VTVCKNQKISLSVTLSCLSCLSLFCLSGTADDWPQWRGKDRDGVWHEAGLIDSFADAEIKRRWSVPLGSGYAGPTVADGRVLVMDRVTEPEESERIHCFDFRTGQNLWSHHYPCAYEGVSYTAGPRAAITIDDGLAYALGATGHLHCIDVTKGYVKWQRDLRQAFDIRMPTWGIAAAPLIEDDKVIVQIGGTPQACFVALDKKTGQTRWQSLDDQASYSAPIAIDQGDRRVVVGWTGERVVGLDPADGRLLWQHPFLFEKWPIAIATPVVYQDRLLLSEVHKGTMLLRLEHSSPAVQEIWHRRENGEPALHSLISTPLIIDAHIFGIDENGVLKCLTLETGEQVWEVDTVVPTQRWATVHMVKNHDRVWMFNDRGELIIAKLSAAGYEEISRAKLLDPTTEQLRRRDGVTWSHPAFAQRHIFARNDKELVCADLSQSQN
jgi:outer membrane protein assembly factor BamB